MNRALIVVVLIAPSILIAQRNTTSAGEKKSTLEELAQTAEAAYAKKDYATCADAFSRLGHDNRMSGMLYNAACCLALGGRKDAAFAMLNEVVDGGFANTRMLRNDADLIPLHEDSRWKDVIARSEANWTKKFGDSNRELWTIMEEDQADRQSDSVDVKAAVERDRKRRARVKEIIAADALKTSMDYFNAALVLQHSDASDDYRKAHELALHAAEIDPANGRAKWLAAAAYDRFLRSVGKPQIYGTQFRKIDGVWVLEQIDETAVTDEERAKWNVPPLAEAKHRAEQMNKKK